MFPILLDPFNFYKAKLSQRHKNPKLKDLAWIVFADYILLKKSKNGLCTCVTCWSEKYRSDSDMHPGHYRPQGQSKLLKFEEDNVWPQCMGCNVMKNGNYREYHIFMLNTVWEQREHYLWTIKETKNWKNYEYAEMIALRWSRILEMKETLNSKRLFSDI